MLFDVQIILNLNYATFFISILMIIDLSDTLEMIHLAAHNRINLVNHMMSRAETCVARMEDPTIPPQGPADPVNLTIMAADGDDPFV